MAGLFPVRSKRFLITSRGIAALFAAVVVVTGALPPLPASSAFADAVVANPLKSDVEDFWHFAKVARYDAANAKANAIVAANADPVAVLATFEEVAKARGDDLSAWMLRFGNVPAIKDSADAVQKLLADGRYGRRGDPKFIEENINRLIVSQIGYQNGVSNLRNSGELAVPLLIDYLRSPAKAEYHDAVRRALREVGKVGLNPLVAVTETDDVNTLSEVVDLIGDLGYSDAAPYIQRVAALTNSEEVRSVAERALAKLTPAAATADAGFLDLAEKFYYSKAAVAADNRNPVAYIWYWDAAQGLVKKDVDHAIYAELMAMRSSEYALQLAGEASSDVGDNALSLWVASNYKRQLQLPEGQVDPTRAENQPDAHYYGVTAGPKYLDPALARALNDGDSAVAYELVKSSIPVVGRGNLDVAGGNSAIVQALGYPDRRVRYEAAIALSMARPAAAFGGSDSVVPTLGEALTQTGKPTALLVIESSEAGNAIAEELRQAGYAVAATTSAVDILAVSGQLPTVDAVVISSRLPGDGSARSLDVLNSTPRLRGASRVVLVETSQSAFESMKESDKRLSTAIGFEAADVAKALEAARTSSGLLPINETDAEAYAIRAAGQLLDISKGNTAYDVMSAKPAVLSALEDARPTIAVYAGGILAAMDDAGAQKALAARAGMSDLAPELKIASYTALSTSAKTFGNKLDAEEVQAIETAAATEADLAVRSAAAEARGALNLPADQAKRIVLSQSTR
jgi:CheY-like chemotaxis protein